MSKTMSRIVPGLALAAAIVASTAAIPSKAEPAEDAAAGEHVFARCLVCHSPKAGENKIGPSLAGVFGRKSGSAPGYDYSPAMKSAGITWDEQELDKYLTNPPADVHGTKMVISLRLPQRGQQGRGAGSTLVGLDSLAASANIVATVAASAASW